MGNHLYRRIVFIAAGLFCTSSSTNVFAFSAEINDVVLKKQESHKLSFELGIDHQSYYNSGVTTSGLGFDFLYESKHVKTKVFGLLQKQEGLDESFNFAWSAPELYFNKKLSPESSLKVGRVLFDASKSNRDLEISGFWNNSWDYRKDNPLQEGLMGLFYERKSKILDLQVFTSVLSVPKLVSHFDFNNSGRVKSVTPWFESPPDQITYSGSEYNVKYFLEDIDYVDIALNPQVGFSGQLKGASNSFRLSYLYAPARDLDIGLSFLVDASEPETPIELTIQPEATYFHKFGFEWLVNWSSNSKTTASFSMQIRESGLPVEANRSWIGLGDGAYSFLAHEVKILGAQAKAFATLSSLEMNSVGELDTILRDSLSVSYRFSNGFGFSLNKNLNSSIGLKALSYYDVENEGVLSRLSVAHSGKKAGLEIGFSFIEALSDESSGFYKDFRGNDQIYSRLNYVF